MTVRQIVEGYLKEYGFEGLVGDDCGCTIEDMFSCDLYCADCEPGYLHPGDEEAPYYMKPHKPEKETDNDQG